MDDDSSDTGCVIAKFTCLEPRSDYSSGACEFWDSALGSRILHIGNAPPAQQYSGVIISSIEALDREKRILQDAITTISRRCSSEEQALRNALHTIYEHLACERHAIDSSIATIHYHRNALIPMARLPPEILFQIFVFHARLERKWLKGPLTSTRVCKRWRQIGLSCPGLWSRIDYEDCRSVAGMETMIKRSRSAPLYLAINDRANTSSQMMGLVVKNLHRFKSFDLLVQGRNTYVLSKLFSKPAPLLQHLQISYTGLPAFTFPPEFLSGSAPNLRHIKLTTTSYVPWNSKLFANLATLEVNGGRCDGPDTPSLEMLLSALARMPALEILILCDCFPQIPSATAAHVDLPNLKQLRMIGPLRDVTCFLSKITINASAAVRLRLKCLHVSKEDVEQLFMTFPSHLFTSGLPTVWALKFGWQASFDFRVGVWMIQPDAKVLNSRDPGIKLLFNWDSPRVRGITPLDLTWTCFAALVSPQLRSFHMSGLAIGWDAEVWRKVARVSPGLRRLTLGSKTQSVKLCEALHPPDKRDLVLADCCFPVLSYLELEVPYDNPMLTADGKMAPLSEVLSRSLSMRAAVGCLTPELVFISSLEDFPEGWSDPFRTAVPGIIVREDDDLGNEVMVRFTHTAFSHLLTLCFRGK
ncbi:hypothetical protein BD779DRAFT_1805735 [Infundibulicybe gibba]|nr:hypothetical protein BD779DRAFT_1805735 [Infundibulicybe gibba]